jgi:hypothetical protein
VSSAISIYPRLSPKRLVGTREALVPDEMGENGRLVGCWNILETSTEPLHLVYIDKDLFFVTLELKWVSNTAHQLA